MGSGLIGSNLKNMFSDEPFTVARNWLTLDRAVPRLQMSSEYGK